MSTAGGPVRDDLGDETTSLLRALLLCTIVEHRTNAAAAEEAVTIFAVERALGRLDAKTYGTCDTCALPIPLDRLLEAPHVQHCATCPSRRSQFGRWLG